MFVEPDPPELDSCGSCRNCLDICPTNAFPAPYTLDASRCISYLTIEHKGHIPVEFREAIGNRVYGCDDCLAVCPWNKFARSASEAAFMPREDLVLPLLREFLHLDEQGFRDRFRATPIKRTGRERFLRNVLIAVSNSHDPSLIDEIKALLDDPSPLVRAMAVWAIGCLAAEDAFSACAATRMTRESDPDVLKEWHRILQQK